MLLREVRREDPKSLLGGRRTTFLPDDGPTISICPRIDALSGIVDATSIGIYDHTFPGYRFQMPTVGWIREDDWEAFLEGTERVPDPRPQRPPFFRCPFCDTILETRRQLQDHVSASHHVARPILLFGNKEPAQTSIVRAVPSAKDLVLANATAAEIKIDGSNHAAIPVKKLAGALLKIRQGQVTLRLTNASQDNAAPVSTSYEISFRIADGNELKAVELAFSDIIMSALTRASIDRFLNDPRCRRTGSDYAHGLASFALGVLLKERPASEHLTTPFARYRESYGSALLVLSDFRRPFSRLISEVIRFALNDFSVTRAPTGYWELDLANALLKDPKRRYLPPAPGAASMRRKICPVDHGTGQILDLAVRMSQQKRWSPILDNECRQISKSDVLDAMDRQKALAIWAIAAWRLGAKDNAVEPLRQISATYPFKIWAEPYLEAVTQ